MMPGLQSSYIMVVDDNPTNLKLAAAILEAEGFATRVADDAAAALAQMRSDPPLLALIDLKMPGMDGLTLAQQLRNEPATRRIRIIALSACATDLDRDRAAAAGCVGFIPKPIDAEQFPRHLAKIVAAVPAGPATP